MTVLQYFDGNSDPSQGLKYGYVSRSENIITVIETAELSGEEWEERNSEDTSTIEYELSGEILYLTLPSGGEHAYSKIE